MKIIVVYAMVMESHAKLLKVILTIPEELVSLFISNTQETSSCLIILGTGSFEKLYCLKLHSSLQELQNYLSFF